MLDLFFISFVSLYFEILFIRWLPGEVHLLGFFKNVVLLSAFSGLGTGLLYRRNPSSSPILFFPFLLLLLLVSFRLAGSSLHTLSFSGSPSAFYLWGNASQDTSFMASAGLYMFLAAIYLFVLFLFFFLGRELGFRFSRLAPLQAYAVNLIASLAGILTFTALSSFSTPPPCWFFIGFIFLLPLMRFNKNSFFFGLACCFLCLILLMSGEKNITWSPYYKIQVSPVSSQVYDVSVNGYWHQVMFPFPKDRDAANTTPDGSALSHYYMPYRFGPRKTVLVLGAGTGNDVVAALRNGAKSVDAVEIDPVILRLGKTLHPDKPYDSPQVRVLNDDARSFVSKTRKKYDLITLGFLDSHSAFSQMHTLRLDNFVYTIESFKKAKSRLAPDGILSLSFAVAKPWIKERLEEMLYVVFEKKPFVYTSPGMVTFSVGKTTPSAPIGTSKNKIHSGAPLATDDWPHLYLHKRGVPLEYLALIFTLVLLTFLCYVLSGNILGQVNFHFFFLGCAFMLIETKCIAQFALLFGSTWQVNTVVISSVLFMALAANIAAAGISCRGADLLYSLILLSLLAEYFFPLNALSSSGFLLKAAIAGTFFFFPVFLAGFIFSSSLKQSPKPELSLGSNFLGAVAGGFSEYASLMAGMKLMTLLVLFFYLLSWFSYKMKK